MSKLLVLDPHSPMLVLACILALDVHSHCFPPPPTSIDPRTHQTCGARFSQWERCTYFLQQALIHWDRRKQRRKQLSSSISHTPPSLTSNFNHAFRTTQSLSVCLTQLFSPAVQEEEVTHSWPGGRKQCHSYHQEVIGIIPNNSTSCNSKNTPFHPSSSAATLKNDTPLPFNRRLALRNVRGTSA